ncbi:hypothetical protein ABH917_002906 [Thermobifida halotolerans]
MPSSCALPEAAALLTHIHTEERKTVSFRDGKPRSVIPSEPLRGRWRGPGVWNPAPALRLSGRSRIPDAGRGVARTAAPGRLLTGPGTLRTVNSGAAVPGRCLRSRNGQIPSAPSSLTSGVREASTWTRMIASPGRGLPPRSSTADQSLALVSPRFDGRVRGGYGPAATPGEVEAFHRTLRKRATTGCRWWPAPDGQGGIPPLSLGSPQRPPRPPQKRTLTSQSVRSVRCRTVPRRRCRLARFRRTVVSHSGRQVTAPSTPGCWPEHRSPCESSFGPWCCV